MIKKKLLTGAIVGALAIASLGTTAVSAAGNYRDTGFYFRFNGYDRCTDYREKRDYTSSYMRCDGCEEVGTFYIAHVVASNSDRIDQRVDVSGGHKYKFQTSTKQKMINYVKERGYGYAAIVGEPSTGKQFNAHGYWSPDSI